MVMHNPPHAGEFIRSVYLEPFGLSAQVLSNYLGVASFALDQVFSGQSAISPEMALHLY